MEYLGKKESRIGIRSETFLCAGTARSLIWIQTEIPELSNGGKWYGNFLEKFPENPKIVEFPKFWEKNNFAQTRIIIYLTVIWSLAGETCDEINNLIPRLSLLSLRPWEALGTRLKDYLVIPRDGAMDGGPIHSRGKFVRHQQKEKEERKKVVENSETATSSNR